MTKSKSRRARELSVAEACPCGAPDCACALYHEGAVAPDALALMRSRYSAYVLQSYFYLMNTWHPATRPTEIELDQQRWLGLEVKKYTIESEDSATVEFVARYKVNGRAYRLHENSNFVREQGKWFYLDGEYPIKGQKR